MKRVFNSEEIRLLENNVYTYKVTPTIIKFTDEFKDEFWKLYVTNMPIRNIFKTLGYDINLLGRKRMQGFVYHLRRKMLTDEQRGKRSRVSSKLTIKRPALDIKYSEMKSLDAIKAMETELTYLRQEVDFLKKLYSLVDRSNQEKN